MSRNGHSKISRDTSFSEYEIKQPSWTDDYLDAVQKYSVKSKREDATLFDQISQILGNSKSKFSSVEEVVQDMQKRIGLSEFLQKQAQEAGEKKDLFEEFPDLKDFIQDKVEAFPGSAVSAIGDYILQEPKYKNAIPSGEHLPDYVQEYINRIKQENSPEENDSHDTNGKVNLDLDTNTLTDNNPLNGLTPAAY